MNSLREAAYQIDPALWISKVLGEQPTPWQAEFLRAPLGASILVLTARQIGKTTVAAWAIAHCMLFRPGSLSVIACPSQHQSGEAVRKVRAHLVKVGAELKVNNVYGLELKNGSRVLALPSSDDSIRGLTVDGWIVADEASRLNSDLISALRPMRARRPQARFAMMSTAWSRTDPFWTAWADQDPTWLRLKATAEVPGLFSPEYLEQSAGLWGSTALAGNISASPAARRPARSAGTCMSAPHRSARRWWRRGLRLCRRRSDPCAGQSLSRAVIAWSILMRYNPNDVKSWPCFKPQIIAHDVGSSRDRSTAVIGGNSPCGQRLLGIGEAEELPQGLFGSARANALAAFDGRHHRNSLIVADLSNDLTYAETLLETFGQRVIGLHISRSGDGMTPVMQSTRHGYLPVYVIGRTYLIELFHAEMQSELVRCADGPLMRRAYEQLAGLEVEYRGSGTVYVCPPGKHDDLGISFAMLAWAARHRHLEASLRNLEAARRPRRVKERFNWAAVT